MNKSILIIIALAVSLTIAYLSRESPNKIVRMGCIDGYKVLVNEDGASTRMKLADGKNRGCL